MLSRRVWAALLDAVMVAVPVLLHGFSEDLSDFNPWVVALWAWAYAPVCFFTPMQATLGMTIMKVRLVDLDGQAANIQQIAVRQVLMPFSLAIGGVGLFMAFFSARQQTLHDRVAKTLVVRSANGRFD